MSFYGLIRPLLFKLMDAETAHDKTLALASRFPRFAGRSPRFPSSLRTEVAGITFPSPVGLAAGFDKDARAFDFMFRLGFGFVEVGTVTPRPQFGNQRPRVFRLEDQRAIINRFGFNSDGQEGVAHRVANAAQNNRALGVNIGANKDTEDKVQDYIEGIRCFARHAAYITINISSPNTPGLRSLQGGDHLIRLIDRLVATRDEFKGPPLFLKVAPDLTDQEVQEIAQRSLDGGVDALVLTNTTISRPKDAAAASQEMGGLSGEPLKEMSLRVLRAFRSEVGSRIPLIGVGGISTAEDAYQRIRAGASLVQLYTALVYSGPSLIRSINKKLPLLLEMDGFATVAEAVGADERERSKRTKLPSHSHAPSPELKGALASA